MKHLIIFAMTLLSCAAMLRAQTTVDDALDMTDVYFAASPGSGPFSLPSPYEGIVSFSANGTTFEAVFILAGKYNNGNDLIRLSNALGNVTFGANGGFSDTITISLKSVNAVDGDLTNTATFVGFTNVSFTGFTADSDTIDVAGVILNADLETYNLPAPVSTLSIADVSNTDYGISDFGYRFEVSSGSGSGEPAELINLSVRALAGSGDQTLILGYVLLGGETTSKSLYVRGVGPSLMDLEVPSPLLDPELTVYSGETVLLTNDDWSGDDGRATGAFALEEGTLDAVVKSTFVPGAYTVHVNGKGGATGEALIEVYAEGTGEAARLGNASVRANLAPEETLILGITIGGDTNRSFVFRAIGPTLTEFKVEGVHPNPTLTLYSGQTVVAANTSWSGDDGRATGAFVLPDGSLDAVLVQDLAPGAYTLHVTGATGTDAGVILAEIYETLD